MVYGQTGIFYLKNDTKSKIYIVVGFQFKNGKLSMLYHSIKGFIPGNWFNFFGGEVGKKDWISYGYLDFVLLLSWNGLKKIIPTRK